MKLYEAIKTIVQEFGKEIVTNAKVINVFSDYNAFEESKTFKVILKNLIAEGYMDQLMYVRDWANSHDRIINNFIAATSFNEANASYVIKCLAYGLGYTKVVPVYSTTPNPQSCVSSNSKQPTSQQQSSNQTVSYQGVNLDKTPSQFDKLSEAGQRKYKEAAEAYLESIVEFKSDFEKELGVKVSTYMELDQFGNIIPKFEIDGKIKVKYDFAIKFCVLPYDQNNRMMCTNEICVGKQRTKYEVVKTCIVPSQYHKIANINKIVIYWEEY